uniref:hypothetical protein n=1 Tax=Micrococcus luteus TaxID=1270 RepID=UPI001C92BF5A
MWEEGDVERRVGLGAMAEEVDVEEMVVWGVMWMGEGMDVVWEVVVERDEGERGGCWRWEGG